VALACRGFFASTQGWSRIRDGDLDATTLSVAIRIHWTRDVSQMIKRDAGNCDHTFGQYEVGAFNNQVALCT
jgi:hypothetical protein